MEQLISGIVDTQKNIYRSIGQVNAGDDLELELAIQMNGQPIEFINPQAELLMKKADNNRIRQTKDIIYEDGKFKIKVNEQGVTYPGIVTNQLVINDQGRVSTCLFYFNVGASLEREVLQSISKVETLEQLDEYVVTAFSNLDEYETRLIELDATMKTTNEEITVNEAERKANESERKINETIRVENEKERVKKENERVEAEIDRKENELDRIKNENARRIAENTRIARENARENAEINRNAIFEENEAIRNEAEKLREKAEAKRKENFSNLESLNEKLNVAEAERVKAEENREAKETERQLAEIARENAETNREKTYTNFNDAEVDRRNNENARIQAENLRVQEESIRAERFEAAQSTRETKFEEAQNTRDELFKASETARATEEIARERAESTREGNEVIRVNSESLRESAENTRQQEEIKRSQAEALRAEAEEQRVISYEEIKQDNINFKEEMNTDFGNAKTDYFGEEHLNVVDRLNSDFDNVHQRINDSSYLEYSGSNITADNSYYGLTKELSIKGRTLQNLWNTDTNFTLAGKSTIKQSNSLLKPNTTYTIIANVSESVFDYSIGTIYVIGYESRNEYYPFGIDTTSSLSNGLRRIKITTKDETPTLISIGVHGNNTVEIRKATISNVILLEGDYTNTPIEEIPFGEGIFSVGETESNLIKFKSCGKNILKVKDMNYKLGKGVTCKIDEDLNISLESDETCNAYPSLYFYYDKRLFQGKTLTFSCEVVKYNPDIKATVQAYYYDENKKQIFVPFASSNNTHTFSKDITSNYVTLQLCLNNTSTTGVVNSMIVSKLMCEENSTKTDYEPYQESTQELQLTEPLRSLPNGVTDEITEDGEEIRRVGKYTIENDKYMYPYDNSKYEYENTLCFVFTLNDALSTMDVKMFCNLFTPLKGGYQYDKESISRYEKNFYVRIDKTKLTSLDTVGFKKWAVENNLTVYYELAEPIITKHNKNINLKTFEGTTHITSDNYLLPTINCKVPSNVQAVVRNLMLENEELSNTITVMSLKNEETELENIETNLEQDVRLTMLELGVI